MGKEVIEKLILVLEKSLIFCQKILYEPLDVITLGTCFSMFVYIHAHFSCVLIGRNLTAQSTGNQRGIGGGIQISEKRHSCKLSFLFPSLFFFLTTEVITCPKVINAFKRQNSWTDPFWKSAIWDFYSMDMKCCK